jgi:hypothetical protein
MPAVFYQGHSRWNYSTQFSDLFHDTLKDADFVPRFSHSLTDQSGFSNDEIRGALGLFTKPSKIISKGDINV